MTAEIELFEFLLNKFKGFWFTILAILAMTGIINNKPSLVLADYCYVTVVNVVVIPQIGFKASFKMPHIITHAKYINEMYIHCICMDLQKIINGFLPAIFQTITGVYNNLPEFLNFLHSAWFRHQNIDEIENSQQMNLKPNSMVNMNYHISGLYPIYTVPTHSICKLHHVDANFVKSLISLLIIL